MVELKKCIDCQKEFEDPFPCKEAPRQRCPDCSKRYLHDQVDTIKQQDDREFVKKIARQRALQEQQATKFTQLKTGICQDCGNEFVYEVNSILTAISYQPQLCGECSARHLADETAAQQAKEQVEKQRRLRDIREQWRRECGITARYTDVRFETWQSGRPGNVDSIYKKCLAYADTFPLVRPQGYHSLVITIAETAPKQFKDNPRSWGVGKTHLVNAIAHRILDRSQGEIYRCPVHVTTEPDLFRRIQTTYNGGRENEEAIINQLVRVPLLILDDIGKEERRDMTFVQRILFAVINGRYNNLLPVVLTTNKTQKELRQYLGGEGSNEAAFDRLAEMCGGEFAGIKGESYRRRGKG